MKKLIGLIAVIMTVLMLLTACAGTTTQPTATAAGSAATAAPAATMSPAGTAAPEEAVPTKDLFTFVLISEPANIGQEATNNNGRLCTIQVYDSLLMEDPADRTNILPNLADSYEFSEDGLTLTFAIKQGVKFHNGATLTADDVLFSLQNALAVPSNAANGACISAVEKVDDTHVAVKLAYAYKPVLNVLAQPGFCIYNKEYFEKCKAEGTVIDRAPMGTGAYQFVDWVSGEEINFTRFDGYHGVPAKMKDLKIKVMADATAAALALENDECDAFLGVNVVDMPRLDANPETVIYRTTSAGFHMLAINSTKAPFDDVRVRQAIAMATNKEEVFAGGHNNVGWITTVAIPYGYFGYPETFEDTAFNLDAAKALLAEAGYPDGFKCTLKCKQDSYYSVPAQVCQEQLRKLGLDCELLIQETGTFDTEVDTNMDYDIAYLMTTGSYPDADAAMYFRFHSSYLGKAKCNIAGVNDPHIDELLETARQSLDDAERLACYKEICEINRDNVYYIPLVTSTNSVCCRSEVVGAYAHGAGAYRIALWAYVAK